MIFRSNCKRLEKTDKTEKEEESFKDLYSKKITKSQISFENFTLNLQTPRFSSQEREMFEVLDAGRKVQKCYIPSKRRISRRRWFTAQIDN